MPEHLDSLFFYCAICVLFAQGDSPNSFPVYPDINGNLVHAGYANEGQTPTGNIINDSSHARYMGGGVAIPWVDVKNATVKNSSVSSDWDNSSKGNLAGYIVYRNTTSGSDGKDTRMSNRTTYYYFVSTVGIHTNCLEYKRSRTSYDES